jgi:nanoRNase/pAp phosphatase (c-di-AMP/oligoRNAs hydrolase)
MPMSHAAAVVGRRACALLAVCSAALHAVMLGHAGSVAVAALLVAMVGVCLFCAWELWRHGSLRAWMLVALMNLGMVAVHLTGGGHHHAAARTLPAATSPSTLMTIATAIAAVEVAAATTVLFYRTRGRATQLAAGRSELA